MQLRYSLLALVLIVLVSAVLVGGLVGCNKQAAPGATGATAAAYTCPMHPEVQSPTPGQCPKCHMNLVKKG